MICKECGYNTQDPAAEFCAGCGAKLPDKKYDTKELYAEWVSNSSTDGIPYLDGTEEHEEPEKKNYQPVIAPVICAMLAIMVIAGTAGDNNVVKIDDPATPTSYVELTDPEVIGEAAENEYGKDAPDITMEGGTIFEPKYSFYPEDFTSYFTKSPWNHNDMGITFYDDGSFSYYWLEAGTSSAAEACGTYTISSYEDGVWHVVLEGSCIGSGKNENEFERYEYSQEIDLFAANEDYFYLYCAGDSGINLFFDASKYIPAVFSSAS